ncbi:hemagglutinin/amebocyte aggregation factor-like [Gigantopelta aegis]|uniref:hemagglutinin/amebocyte aggregation factor-like n=1 Tax=Gigantopelta aegis TaxID=1735272 RepID=UPI001B88AB55|nr:hemagglutinin/amebocyte aggregation factor-like [Gigantopelta aegis]
MWDFACQKVGTTTRCVITGWINNWDELIAYECHGIGALVGVESKHNNAVEDRRFKFKCCAVRGLRYNSCYTSNYINVFDGNMDKQNGNKEVFKGIYSYHSNRHEDRRWKVKICRVVPSRHHPKKMIKVLAPKPW